MNYLEHINRAVDAFALFIGSDINDENYDRERHKQSMIDCALRKINMFSKNNPDLKEMYDNDDWSRLRRFVTRDMSPPNERITTYDFNLFPPEIQYAVLSTYVKRIAAEKLSRIDSERIYSEEELFELLEKIKMDAVSYPDDGNLERCHVIIHSIYRNYAALAKTPLLFLKMFEIVRIIDDFYYEGATLSAKRFETFLKTMTEENIGGKTILESILEGNILPEQLALFENDKSDYYGMSETHQKAVYPLPIDMQGKLQHVSDPANSVDLILEKIAEHEHKIINMQMSPVMRDITEGVRKMVSGQQLKLYERPRPELPSKPLPTPRKSEYDYTGAVYALSDFPPRTKVERTPLILPDARLKFTLNIPQLPDSASENEKKVYGNISRAANVLNEIVGKLTKIRESRTFSVPLGNLVIAAAITLTKLKNILDVLMGNQILNDQVSRSLVTLFTVFNEDVSTKPNSGSPIGDVAANYPGATNESRLITLLNGVSIVYDNLGISTPQKDLSFNPTNVNALGAALTQFNKSVSMAGGARYTRKRRAKHMKRTRKHKKRTQKRNHKNKTNYKNKRRKTHKRR